MYTGEDDINNLGRLYAFQNKTELKGMWKSQECNIVNGSDGSQFPPSAVYGKENIEIYIKGFCRKFPLSFDSEVSIFSYFNEQINKFCTILQTTALDDIPVYRYKPARNVFDTSKTNPDNKCYEIDDKYVYDGVFLDAPCMKVILPIISQFNLNL